jgi:hypothetical protein
MGLILCQSAGSLRVNLQMAGLVATSRLQRELQAVDIITGPPVYIRKKVYYTGYATTTYSIEQASSIIDFIGNKTDSEDCLPFAVRLVEGGELISIAEGQSRVVLWRECCVGNLYTMCGVNVALVTYILCVVRR